MFPTRRSSALMGMARGFVERIVEAHHAFEQGQRLCKLFRIRCAARGIGGKGQQALDLAFTRRRDFLCHAGCRKLAQHGWNAAHPALAHHHRSEEHTSELQSLMRTSYAVFGLKKKRYVKNNDQRYHQFSTTNLRYHNYY